MYKLKKGPPPGGALNSSDFPYFVSHVRRFQEDHKATDQSFNPTKQPGNIITCDVQIGSAKEDFGFLCEPLSYVCWFRWLRCKNATLYIIAGYLPLIIITD